MNLPWVTTSFHRRPKSFRRKLLRKHKLLAIPPPNSLHNQNEPIFTKSSRRTDSLREVRFAKMPNVQFGQPLHNKLIQLIPDG